MEYRILGKTGLKVSVIDFGGIPIQRVSTAEASATIDRALDKGINFLIQPGDIPTARQNWGRFMKNRRKEAIIATKSMARTKGDMARDIEKSLAALGVDYIDLYQLHNVKDKNTLEQVLSPQGALSALKEAKKDGLIKHIGITGHIKNILCEALKTGEIETVQFPFNAVELEGSRELFSLAGEMNAGIIIMKPLAGGALKDANLALRFILEYPVSTVIPGMDTPEQVDENTLVGKNPAPLTPEERKKLEEKAERLGNVFCRRCEYCQPCPQGIDIPMVFLLDGYFTRYDLKKWARERYRALPSKADSCVECGECEDKCPYNLPIRRMLADASSRLG